MKVKTMLGAALAAALMANAAASYADDVINMRFANAINQAAKDAAVAMIDVVEKESGGTIKIKHFPDNMLGDDRVVTESTMLGDIDMVQTMPSVLASMIPDLYVWDAPFLFNTMDEAWKCMDSELGLSINTQSEKKGLKYLAALENGFRHYTNNKVPVKVPADVKGQKLRVMETEIQIALWRTYGANPTPMAFTEVISALQQGTIDGTDSLVVHTPVATFVQHIGSGRNKPAYVSPWRIYTDNTVTIRMAEGYVLQDVEITMLTTHPIDELTYSESAVGTQLDATHYLIGNLPGNVTSFIITNTGAQTRWEQIAISYALFDEDASVVVSPARVDFGSFTVGNLNSRNITVKAQQATTLESVSVSAPFSVEGVTPPAPLAALLVAAAPFTVSLRLDEKLAGYAAQFSFQDEAAGFRGELEDMEEKRRGRLGEIYSRAVEEQVEEMAAEAGIQVREVRAEIGMDPDREDFGQVTEVSLVWVRPSEFGAEPEKEPGAEPGERVEKIEEVEPVRIGALRGEENREEENQEEGNRGEGSRVEAAPAGAKPALSGEDERAARALVRRIAEACHMEESHVEIQLEYE